MSAACQRIIEVARLVAVRRTAVLAACRVAGLRIHHLALRPGTVRVVIVRDADRCGRPAPFRLQLVLHGEVEHRQRRILARITHHEAQPIALRQQLVEGELIAAGAHRVMRDPGGTRHLLPQCGVEVLAAGIAGADTDRAIALLEHLVERRLILRRRHAVARLPGGSRALLPDRGVKILARHRVAIHPGQSITLGDKLVERRLVLSGGKPVACLPGDGRVLLPQRRIHVLTAHRIAADGDQAIALCDHLIECVLVVGRIHPMMRLPGGTAGLLPQRRIQILSVGRVTADHAQPVALLEQGVERGLILAGTHAVSSLPRRSGRLVPDRRIEIVQRHPRVPCPIDLNTR